MHISINKSLNDVFMTVSVRKEEYATDLENSAATNIPPIVRTSYKPKSNAFMKNTKKSVVNIKSAGLVNKKIGEITLLYPIKKAHQKENKNTESDFFNFSKVLIPRLYIA